MTHFYLRCNECGTSGEGFAVVVDVGVTDVERYECMKCGATDVGLGRPAP